jgi:hypothetical protein
MLKFEFENVFDATKCPEVANNDFMMQELEKRVNDMKTFMDKMRGGVKHMRSKIEHDGVVYDFELKLT